MTCRHLAGCAVVVLAVVACRNPAPVTAASGTIEHQPTTTEDVVLRVIKSSTNEILLTKTLRARRDAVFAAMTQPEHLLRWMRSPNMTFVACDVDLRVGGSFRYQFQRPSGTKIEVRGTYKSIDVPRLVAYTETYDFSPLKIEVTTVLDEKGENTVFSQTLHYSSQTDRDGDFDAVATSAAEAYDNLDRYLASSR